RSFASESYSSSSIALREFDLRFVHRTPLSRHTDVRLGAGMSARYLTFGAVPANSGLKSEYSTPASLFLLGFSVRFNSTIGLAGDLSMRSRMINDTIDRGSFDAALRLTGTF